MFKADDLLESDFDIVLVLKYKQVKETFPHLNTTDLMREAFFFGSFTKALSSDFIKVFPVNTARNPILKLKVKVD